VPDYAGALQGDIRDMRIGIVSHFWTEDLPASTEVQAGMHRAIETLRGLGAELCEVRLQPLTEFHQAKLTIQRPELFFVHGEDVRSRPDAFGPKLRARMLEYANVKAVDYLEAKKRQRELTAETLQAMGGCDVLVTVGPGPATKIDDVAERANPNVPDVTLPFNLTGMPAVVTCIGMSGNSLPFSMQIVGQPFDERAVLRAADAYERVTEWHLRRPEIRPRSQQAAVA
jgi:aspartyl-tRNA(Asn)/glutamyl-tRNA(Gln) amidotransferase subunit A